MIKLPPAEPGGEEKIILWLKDGGKRGRTLEGWNSETIRNREIEREVVVSGYQTEVKRDRCLSSTRRDEKERIRNSRKKGGKKN
jgi:hypothetical protein